MSGAVHRQLVQAALRAPMLGREEEQDLATRWREQGDAVALHRLTTAHMRLVMAIAARFRAYGLPMPDLVQEGNVGLLEAARRFEPARDVRFSTYAAWWVRAAIQDYVLRNWSIVRGGTSSGQKALFFNLRRIRRKLLSEMRESGTGDLTGRIAEILGVSRADVEMMEARLSAPDLSLDAPLTDEDGAGERMDFLPCDKPTPDEAVSAAVDSERYTGWMRSALAQLSDRERRIVRARRLSEEGQTLESLGAALGISKERVRQIENRALEKLKQALLAIEPRLMPARG